MSGPQNVNVDISDCKDVVCSNCDCPLFVDAFMAKRVPGLLIGAPEDQPGFGTIGKVCLKCHKPFMETFMEGSIPPPSPIIL